MKSLKSLKQILNEQKVNLTYVFNKLIGKKSRIFKIDVSTIPQGDIDEYVRKFVSKYKNPVEIKELTEEDKRTIKNRNKIHPNDGKRFVGGF